MFLKFGKKYRLLIHSATRIIISFKILHINGNNFLNETNTSIKEFIPVPFSEENSAVQWQISASSVTEINYSNKKEQNVHIFSTMQNSLNKAILLSTSVI